MELDLNNPETAYFVGFVQGDGTLTSSTRNRGRLSIELSARDRDILEHFQALFPSINSTLSTRVRDTNFKVDYESVVLTFHDLGFRQALGNAGITTGRKSHTVKPPTSKFSEHDFYRGLIDADGAVGFTAGGWPFVSLNTSSDDMSAAYHDYVKRVTGAEKNTKRNARDNTYNIVLTREHAQELCRLIYYPGCLALDRKRKLAYDAINWIRPIDMKLAPPRKRWDKIDDAVVIANSVDKAAKILNRTTKSIVIRRWRLGL